MARDGHNLHHHSHDGAVASLSLSLSFIQERGQNLFFLPSTAHSVFEATISLPLRRRPEPLQVVRWTDGWAMSFLMMSYGDGLRTTGASAMARQRLREGKVIDGHLAPLAAGR